MTGPLVEIKQYLEGKAIRFSIKDYTSAGVKQAYDLGTKKLRLILVDAEDDTISKTFDSVADPTKLAITTPASGIVDFTPRINDLDVNKLYNAEFQVYDTNFLDPLEDFQFKVLKILKKI